jgi:hypothetical protein
MRFASYLQACQQVNQPAVTDTNLHAEKIKMPLPNLVKLKRFSKT